jgi:uncharacterized protein (TIGR01244 family)
LSKTSLLPLAGLLLSAGCLGPPARLKPQPVESKEVNANYWKVGDYYLAGQPTKQGFREAQAKGVKTVIDLRPPEEEKGFDEKALLQSLSLDYLNLPVTSGKKLDPTVVERFLSALKSARKPALIHCGSANRVSGLWAVHLALDEGLSTEEAIAVAQVSGLKSEDLKAAIRDYLKTKR